MSSGLRAERGRGPGARGRGIVRRFAPALVLAIAASAAPQTWGPYRGANTRPTSTDEDVKAFAELGGNLLRVNMNTRPLVKKQPPYDLDEESFRLIDNLLEACRRHGVAVVIDPHTTPGTEKPTTTNPDDLLWQDFSWHEHLIRLWTRIAARYKDAGPVIAGYDLLNEPSLPNGGEAGTPADWNLLVRKLVKAIRAADKTHTIIIEPPVVRMKDGKRLNRLQGMAYLEAPPGANVVYSPHMYEPHEFTHQGVQGRPEGIAYPGTIAGKRWDSGAIAEAFAPVVRFQKQYRVHVFMGEFSAPRWQGEDGNRYVRDVIEACERNGWSWAYHSWREAEVWDAERDNFNRESRDRQATTPRLEILREFMRRGTPARSPR